jgi:uncharacterized protein (TIGR02118 family)
MINRIERMSVDKFVEYHRHHHCPLFSSIPEAKKYVRRYVVSHPDAESYPQPAYDGLTENWFDSWADHNAFFTSDNYLQNVQPDEKKFIDFNSVGVMVTEEKVMI